jgi:hypothetical protein
MVICRIAALGERTPAVCNQLAIFDMGQPDLPELKSWIV